MEDTNRDSPLCTLKVVFWLHTQCCSGIRESPLEATVSIGHRAMGLNSVCLSPVWTRMHFTKICFWASKRKGRHVTFPSIDKASAISVGQKSGALIATLIARVVAKFCTAAQYCVLPVTLPCSERTPQPNSSQHTQQGQHICWLPSISEGWASH